MQRWPAARLSIRSPCTLKPRRLLSSAAAAHVESISVPCASSGSVTVSLHNVSHHPSSAPLLVYLPPFSLPASEGLAGLPPLFHPYPTAAIHYRWPDTAKALESLSSGRLLQWPTPLHDTLFGYDWILNNLSRPGLQRRDIYVCGSHLGAGLAATLALTESHPHQSMAVRGLLAYNGIYDWTSFLPDHPVNRARSHGLDALEGADLPEEGSAFGYLRQLMPVLFGTPSNLFDPFASAVLLFRTAGMLVPESFTASSPNLPPSLLDAIDELSGEPLHGDDGTVPGVDVETAPKAPRRGYLAFPPRQSSLRIPEALLLHESAAPPPPPGSWRRRRRSMKKARAGRNDFESQAAELAGLMRRSIDKLELRERMKWDDEFDGWEGEAQRRVRVGDVGRVGDGGFELGEKGEEMAREWLEEKLGSG
ncbi:Leukaemia virus receptor (BLVR) domain-containing protein [Pleurostoma richardsiae]|uniref:Leukaemia virus receptor (BLVR) domain-containing protein n=1 Tax=Pleurostoma richardsiae TaxID=41990 RepID=A0AA38VHT6_9PEZI|nr:Leukaemia virus receptor (BLVR) domain-containing protein [Pleurostoma richardsiae]